MILNVCVETRNKAIPVPVLHMLLQLSVKCFSEGHHIMIHFMEDTKGLNRLVRMGDRVMWCGYGHSLDGESFDAIFNKAADIIVFPSVIEGVDWDKFRSEVKSGTSEPIEQIGLKFDTDVDKPTGNGFWTVKRTHPSVLVFDGKAVDKKLRTKKGEGLKLPPLDELFDTCQKYGVKTLAYTKAKVLIHFTHECLGNILEANGIVCQAP